MVVSMTGYGRSKMENPSYTIEAEIRSVNHRFLDLHIRSTEPMMHLEEKIKKSIQKFLKRGRLDVHLNIQRHLQSAKQLNVDWTLIEDYYRFILELKKKYALADDIRLEHFLTRSEFFQFTDLREEDGEFEALLMRTVEDAAKNVLAMRKREGELLQRELLHYLSLLKKEWEELQALSPQPVERYREQLYKKINLLTNGNMDENRLLTEVALFADRIDFSEELDRLKSHFAQFEAVLAEEEPVGRKIDFLLQEMNREVNTIGSKGNDAGVSKKVVEMKSLLEKMREQAQNIE